MCIVKVRLCIYSFMEYTQFHSHCTFCTKQVDGKFIVMNINASHKFVLKKEKIIIHDDLLYIFSLADKTSKTNIAVVNQGGGVHREQVYPFPVPTTHTRAIRNTY